MLIRNTEGKLLEINRYDHKNDHVYYKKIMQIKNIRLVSSKSTNYSGVLIQNAIENNLPK